MTDYELYHHGIKGQKWGVRRTAAQLGHRTVKAAGKTGKAIGKGMSKASKAAKKAAVAKVKRTIAENKEKNYYKKLHKKKLSQMTDKEIADLTKRVKVEASLKDAKYEFRAQNARKFYKTVAQQPLNTFLATYSKKAIDNMFKENKNDSDNGGGDDSNGSGNSKNGKQGKNSTKPAVIEVEVETESGNNQRKKNPVIIRR